MAAKKKYVLEFGVRGGQLTDNLVFSTLKLAARTASDIARVLSNSSDAARQQSFMPDETFPRRIWQSETHFVALSLLDGVPRGSASATLWKKP